ncbi:hypothetical protein [Sphingomonas baiyangensis]|uniref:DUF1302 domain-containing protein n=1 Tax=Sphingomonas baiyangensis TaxID=2572576 RepID=A0A4U1L460_9SPHN|nr:hypothetical protein [Sphingomonas baiyangensis]TKD50926.1 hypothetical protein FBR43_09250 [Sphingomonas baiyangensis]
MKFAYLLGGTAALAAAQPAFAQQQQQGGGQRQSVVSPYIQVGQILTADLQTSDVLTFTSVAAGVDVAVQTQRVEFQLNYQYEHRFSWDDQIGDDDVHSGLARGAFQIAPGLTIEGGALATRARSDFRGAAPGNLVGDISNISQLYSLYAGPSYSGRIDDFAVNALYRVGYTKVETPDNGVGLLPGEPRLDYYDDALSHLATASIGTWAGTYAPFGFTLSGAYAREDAGQLDQRYEGWFARGDIVQPLSPTLALVGGVGWEQIEISQKDALVGADGFPVLDGNGRFVTDPASPQRIAYDIDGVFYDAGVLWRPSPRTTLEARIGERYGTFTGIGSLSYQIDAASGIQVGVYDSVTSFGRQLNSSLSSLPTSFNTPFDAFSDQYNGCIFGTEGGAVGGCLSPVLQSIATANFRARGVDAVYAATVGPTRYGLGAGYAHRRFIAPDDTLGLGIDGLADQSYYLQTFAAHNLSIDSVLTGDIYLNYFDSGLGLGGDIWGAGATAAYVRQLGRVNAIVTAGVYTFDQEGAPRPDVSGQALLGLGYRF